MALSLRILGPLTVMADDKEVRLGGALRERTLTMLLLEPNRVVPILRLVEAAWDDQPPHSAQHQIRKAVAELRQRIPGGAQLLRTEGPGYRAEITEDQLDLSRYRARLRHAREAMVAGRTAQAAEDLQAALELWRGPVMAGAGGPVIEAASSALEEQHLSAVEQLFELRLAAGEAREVIGELRALVHRYPLRETLRAHLMLALYQTGRQAEALAEYGRLRDLLADELGIDPSVNLSNLYSAILRQSPELAAPAPPSAESSASAGAPPEPVVPHNLPYDLRDFAGRTVQLRWITELCERAEPAAPLIVAIDGMGGSGKTSLAVRAAHQLADRFPDGRILVDLCGYTPAAEPLSTSAAAEMLLAVAGVTAEEIPSTATGRVALWQSITQRRRLLVVLDNAAGIGQVRPLIPTAPGCLTIITSRPRLVDLDGAQLLSLGTLSEEDGAAMLRQILGEERVAHEPAAALELVRLCGQLPLAIRIAAGRLRNRSTWTVQRLVERLRDETRRLEELSSGSRSLAGMLRLSYESMPPEQRNCIRLLGLHPGRSIDTEEAAALFGTSLGDAEDLLEPLLTAHLLEEHRSGWYRLHDLVRNFIHGLAEQETAAADEQAVRRLLDHYVITAERAGDILFPERFRYGDFLPEGESLRPEFASKEAALQWFDQHRDNLLAAVSLAHGRGMLRHAAYLPRELGFHSDVRNYPHESHAALQIAVEAARELGGPALLRLSLTNLAMEQWRLGKTTESIVSLEEALALARSLGDRRSEAACMSRLGQIYNGMGDFRTAVRFTKQAVALEQELSLVRERGASLTVLSSANVRLGEFQAALAAAEEAVGLFEQIGELRLPPISLSYQALALAGLARLPEALQRLDRARHLCLRLDGSADTAFVLAQSADMWVRAGDLGAARACAEDALERVGAGDDTVRRAVVQNAAGRVCRALGEFPTALRRHRQANELALVLGFRHEQAQALDGLAHASGQLGDLAAAAEYQHQADALYGQLEMPDQVRQLF